MSAEMGERQLPVASLIERHRQAFAALERYTEIVDRLDEDGDKWASGQLELSRLESDVEQRAIAMTKVLFSSIDEVVCLLSYIDEFSRSRKVGYLLWPDLVSVSDREMPWSFVALRTSRFVSKNLEDNEEDLGCWKVLLNCGNGRFLTQSGRLTICFADKFLNASAIFEMAETRLSVLKVGICNKIATPRFSSNGGLRMIYMRYGSSTLESI
jgi:hypothetical protein